MSTTYNPHRYRRQVRRTGEGYVVKSMTRRDDVRYEVRFDPDGTAHCDCYRGQYLHRRFNATIWSPEEHLCKHAQQLRRRLEREGKLPQQRGRFTPTCVRCGALDADNYFPLVGDRGEPISGFICCDCAEASVDDLDDEPDFSDLIEDACR